MDLSARGAYLLPLEANQQGTIFGLEIDADDNKRSGIGCMGTSSVNMRTIRTVVSRTANS